MIAMALTVRRNILSDGSHAWDVVITSHDGTIILHANSEADAYKALDGVKVAIDTHTVDIVQVMPQESVHA